jgi:hypothetical protein
LREAGAVSLQRIGHDIDVSQALAEVLAADDMWGAIQLRTMAADSPHRETQDVWLRYRAADELTDAEAFSTPHWSSWYPCMARLPSLKPIIFDVMRRVEGTHLGGCLLTRIPAGKRVYEHTDGGWHAETMNAKLYVILQANAACINYCGDDQAVMESGSVWRFDNSLPHSVINGGGSDRIACIVTCRVET